MGESIHKGSKMYIIKERPPEMKKGIVILNGKAFEIKSIISKEGNTKIGLIGLFL
jgi:hypothetical protein